MLLHVINLGYDYEQQHNVCTDIDCFFLCINVVMNIILSFVYRFDYEYDPTPAVLAEMYEADLLHNYTISIHQ